MRTMIPVMIAAGLVIAGPAAAQDTNNMAAANTTAPAATDSNMAAPDANAVGAMPANDVAPAPEVTTTDTETSQQSTPKSGGGFPWGVLGLLGLIGLIPRRGRG
jgi:hypothetical protein